MLVEMLFGKVFHVANLTVYVNESVEILEKTATKPYFNLLFI